MSETLLVYGLHQIPESLTHSIPAASPVRGCLFWAAQQDSEVVEALFDAIPEPSIEDEDEGLALAMTIASAAATSPRFRERVGKSPGFQGGFHTAGREAVEPWLRERAHLVDVHEVLDDVLIVKAIKDGKPFDHLHWKPLGTSDDEMDMLHQLYEAPGLYAIKRSDPEFAQIELVFAEERRIPLEHANHPDLVLELDADQLESLASNYNDVDFD